LGGSKRKTPKDDAPDPGLDIDLDGMQALYDDTVETETLSVKTIKNYNGHLGRADVWMAKGGINDPLFFEAFQLPNEHTPAAMGMFMTREVRERVPEPYSYFRGALIYIPSSSDPARFGASGDKKNRLPKS